MSDRPLHITKTLERGSKEMKKAISILLSMSLILGLVACGSKPAAPSEPDTSKPASSAPAKEEVKKDPIKLKVSVNHGATDPNKSDETMYGYAFKEYMDEHCDTIDVELYTGGTLGHSADVMGSIAANTVEMGIYEVGTLNNYDPNTMVFSLPGAFRNADEVNYMVDSDWAKNLLEESSKTTNLKVLGASCKGMRCFSVDGYELRTVDDIAGLTFRVMDTPLYVELVKALSANPVPMAMSEVYVAIQNGVIDGQENPLPNIVNDTLYEVQDWIVLDNHAPCIIMYFISREFFESLTPEEQKVIEEASAYAQEKARNTLVELNNSAVETLEAEGVTVYEPTPEELEAWQAKFAPVCEEYMRDQIGDEIVDEMLAVIEEYRT